MRFPRRTQLLTHPSGSPVKTGVRGKVAPERPRRKPQVFPKSHVTRRFFRFFLIAQKETRRRSGETSVSSFRGCSACGRATFQRRKVAKVLRACGPGPRRVALFRWQFRPARCPHDRYLTVIAAALLYRQTTYFYKIRCACVVQHTPWAVDGGPGRFSCVGANATSDRGRPHGVANTGKRIFFDTVFPGGYIQ